MVQIDVDESVSSGGKIVTHWDADGISSVVLYLLSHPDLSIEDVKFPEDFGVYYTDTEIMLDMRPIDDNFNGTVYDHHLGHKDMGNYDSQNRKYKLVWEPFPTAVIVFNQFWDKIPEDKWWIVAVGAAGDGQPETIPPKVFKRHPYLIMNKSAVYSSRGGAKLYPSPVYTKLSSLINAPARWGYPEVSLQALWEAETPRDLYTNQQLIEFAKNLSQEVDRVIKENMEVYDIGPLLLVTYNSEAGLGGQLAWKVLDDPTRTAIIVNMNSLSTSIRGHLALYVAELLNEHGYGQFGGHPGFVGGKLFEPIDENELVKILVSLLRGE